MVGSDNTAVGPNEVKVPNGILASSSEIQSQWVGLVMPGEAPVTAASRQTANLGLG